MAIRKLIQISDTELDQLADVLVDCVEGGASVSFMHPLSVMKAKAFWCGLADEVKSGERLLYVAEDQGRIVGTVQVVFGLPENQPHRGDVSKMLVRRDARRKGLGEALLRAAEDGARRLGKTLLVLDTASDDAERLYRRVGWELAGEIPDYALLPHGGLCSTRFYFRRL